MQIGTKVRIKNLRTIELNERLGKVIGFNNESGRFAVAIASDPMDTTLAAWQAGGEDEGPMTQSVFLKPENIERVPSGQTEPVASVLEVLDGDTTTIPPSAVALSRTMRETARDKLFQLEGWPAEVDDELQPIVRAFLLTAPLDLPLVLCRPFDGRLTLPAVRIVVLSAAGYLRCLLHENRDVWEAEYEQCGRDANCFVEYDAARDGGMFETLIHELKRMAARAARHESSVGGDAMLTIRAELLQYDPHVPLSGSAGFEQMFRARTHYELHVLDGGFHSMKGWFAQQLQGNGVMKLGKAAINELMDMYPSVTETCMRRHWDEHWSATPGPHRMATRERGFEQNLEAFRAHRDAQIMKKLGVNLYALVRDQGLGEMQVQEALIAMSAMHRI